MSIYSTICEKLKHGPLHFTLIDPAFDHKRNIEIVKQAEKAGTDVILVGGSYNTITTDEMIKKVKEVTKLPVIISPGNVHDVSASADAILYYSMLNSRNPYYISQVQALSSLTIKALNLEPISVGYIVFEPGMTAGFVGDANLIRRDKPELALGYALSAQYSGYKMVYFEAGSGADKHVPVEAIKLTKKYLNIPLIVGGGIRTPEAARQIVEAGADIIVTGALVERTENVLEAIKSVVSAIKTI